MPFPQSRAAEQCRKVTGQAESHMPFPGNRWCRSVLTNRVSARTSSHFTHAPQTTSLSQSPAAVVILHDDSACARHRTVFLRKLGHHSPRDQTQTRAAANPANRGRRAHIRHAGVPCGYAAVQHSLSSHHLSILPVRHTALSPRQPSAPAQDLPRSTARSCRIRRGPADSTAG